MAKRRGMCDGCYNAAYLGRSHHSNLLSVECWCRRQIVMVSQTDVMNGRTRTCGQAHCQAKASV